MNLKHDEDSSLDINHSWHGGVCFFNFRSSHDELGESNFQFVLDEDQIESLIDHLTYALNNKK